MSEELRRRLRETRQAGEGATAEAPPAALLADPSQLAEEELPDAYARTAENRRQEVMLELRWATGDCQALAYAFLVSIDFKRSAGITLEFTGYRVSLKGRNLQPLFRGLKAHRVAHVQEVDRNGEALAHEKDTVVTAIQVTEA